MTPMQALAALALLAENVFRPPPLSGDEPGRGPLHRRPARSPRPRRPTGGDTMSLSWMPVLSVWAVVLITCALLGLLVHGSLVLVRKRLPMRWIVLLGLLRLLIVLVFAACLLQPIVAFRRTVPEGPPVFVLLDASQSMGLKDSAAPAGRPASSPRHRLWQNRKWSGPAPARWARLPRALLQRHPAVC